MIRFGLCRLVHKICFSKCQHCRCSMLLRFDHYYFHLCIIPKSCVYLKLHCFCTKDVNPFCIRNIYQVRLLVIEFCFHIFWNSICLFFSYIHCLPSLDSIPIEILATLFAVCTHFSVCHLETTRASYSQPEHSQFHPAVRTARMRSGFLNVK